MRRHLFVIAALLGALTLAGTASAAGGGAAVVRDEGCTTSIFATTCVVVKTTTNSTTTPSGNVSYVTNGTVERTMTFVFGGTFTFESSLHSQGLYKQGEIHETGDHYSEEQEYVSGTYHLLCTTSYDIHWANGDAQVGDYELECTVL